MFNVNLCVLVFLLNMNVRCFVLFDCCYCCYFLICIVCYMNIYSVFEFYNLKNNFV